MDFFYLIGVIFSVITANKPTICSTFLLRPSMSFLNSINVSCVTPSCSCEIWEGSLNLVAKISTKFSIALANLATAWFRVPWIGAAGECDCLEWTISSDGVDGEDGEDDTGGEVAFSSFIVLMDGGFGLIEMFASAPSCFLSLFAIRTVSGHVGSPVPIGVVSC